MTTALATRYRDHSVVGTPAQIANLLANHAAAGTLVAATAARPLPGPDARVRVLVRVAAAPRVAPTAPPRDRRTHRIAALALSAAGVLAGVAAAAAYLLGQLVAFVTAHAAQIVGFLVVAAIFAALIGSRRTGRHCPGC
jgi:hypothetical protein